MPVTFQLSISWILSCEHSAKRLPIVCGGRNTDTGLVTNECNQYNYDGNVWVPTNQNMLESREQAMASLIDSSSWLISGGENGIIRSLDTTEVYKDGSFSYGPSMPTARFAHCQVTLNSSHIAILGGKNTTGYLSDFYLLDWENQDWIPMPDIPGTIYLDPCGLIENSVNGQEHIVL